MSARTAGSGPDGLARRVTAAARDEPREGRSRAGVPRGPTGSMAPMEPASHGERAGATQGLSQLRLDGDGDNGRGADAPILDLDGTIRLGQALIANLGRVVLGAGDALDAAAIAALSGGHLLIEDVPGVGKTVLARALAASLGSDLSRVQGHPDLLPSDVTGVSVFSPDTGAWDFRPGPVFAHVVLVDELNRTPPRTQSALLETMEEQQVSVDGQTWPLPHPHLVIATQNPRSQRGTFPLVESQLDRFAIATSIGYPDADNEAQLAVQQAGKSALAELMPVCTTERWLQAQAATESVVVTSAIAQYAVQLCRATRAAPGVRLGASPRAAIWLIRCAQAHAVLSARNFVAPADVQAVAIGCLSHRVLTDGGDDTYGAARHVVGHILEATATPRP
jgi:MoxR-like ATPase